MCKDSRLNCFPLYKKGTGRDFSLPVLSIVKQNLVFSTQMKLSLPDKTESEGF
jgi:hypothetical protein